MVPPIPVPILDALSLAHPSWRPLLMRGLEAVVNTDPQYLQMLVQEPFLPTEGRLFAAFTIPYDAVRYILVGEGPYPREESATGVCFMDGAVETLWSENGLSKQVNRATSLRNFIKMLLVADGMLDGGNTSGDAMNPIAVKARAIGTPYIQTLTELQSNLTRQGFLLLNASLVFRANVPPVRDAKAWRPFLRTVLEGLARRSGGESSRPKLVLWGKIAEQLDSLDVTSTFPKAVSPHPYNLTFIENQCMQELFGPMHLLNKMA